MSAPAAGEERDLDPGVLVGGGRPFVPGDRVMVIDSKDRRYLVTLSVGGEFHTHAGPVRHDDLIGRPEGVVVRSTRGGGYTAVRPTLSEVILKMPRGAQVIYPKDLGPILMMADVFPGARVLEAGVGSGALSMTLLRAGADVVGYELREDFANRARANVVSFLGEGVLCRYRVQIRDVYDGIDEQGLDRMILDLPEPWRVVKHAETALLPGGILVAYLPTIGQVAQLREKMEDSGLGMAETVEVLHRSWHVDGPSVRPDHRMVAHTGFLTSARLLAGKAGGRSTSPHGRARWDQRGRLPASAEPAPEDPAPEDPGPDDSAPDDSAPDDSAPSQLAPDGLALGQWAPGQLAPGEESIEELAPPGGWEVEAPAAGAETADGWGPDERQ